MLYEAPEVPGQEKEPVQRVAQVGIDNLAKFLSISPNQTKFLLSVCLVPGLDFSAIPVPISAMSLGRL